ncbi:MAG TPA: FlgD immunoglobulin-like domain containing protein, partial [Elusimicrobiota bacterium]|nr:FlgD immunoglobulin-like domain containing protein [Elusimicrobiota bacterium]
MGGDPYNIPIPTIQPQPPPAFSPGLPGSPHPTFTGTFAVSYPSVSVTVVIRDATNTIVRSLPIASAAGPGNASFSWDGKNDQGALLPEGVYAWYLTERSLTDASQFNEQSGRVAIDNTAPQAQFSPISVAGSDTTQLQINGTASDANLVSYELDYSTSPLGPFTSMVGNNIPVTGALGVFNATALADGTYTVRLTATDSAGLASTTTEPATVAHSPSGTGVRLLIGTTAQLVVNAGNSSSASADDPNVFVDETWPPGGGAGGQVLSYNWSFVQGLAYSGPTSHTDPFTDAYPGARLHYFAQASPPYALNPGDNIVQYVYLSPSNPPSEIMLQFYTGNGDGEHRAYWGANRIQTSATSGTPALYYMGALPPVGQWIRLRIPASLVGLDGKSLSGVAYGAYGGRANWDKTTSSSPNQDSQTSYAQPLAQNAAVIQTMTTVTYTLLKAANLTIDVLSAPTETEVKNVFTGLQASGTYSTTWDQTDASGAVTPEGDYFMRFGSPDGPIDSEAIVLGTTATVSGIPATSVTDADGNVYSVDSAHGQVVKDTSAGYGLTNFGQGQLNQPSGLLLDTSGYVTVQDSLGPHRFEVGRRDFAATTLTARIDLPADNNLIKATVPIFGEAFGLNFSSYAVLIAPGWTPSSWTVLNTGYAPATSWTIPPGQQTIYGNLASWETGLTPGEEYPPEDLFHPPADLGYSGRWTVRLNVDTTDGHQATDDVHVIIGRVVNNGTGGLIVSDDGQSTIQVPPLSLEHDWDVFGLITATTTLPSKMPPLPANLVSVGPVYQVIPGSYQFAKPTTFSIALSTWATPIDPSKVGFYQYDEDTGRWDVLSVQRQITKDAGGNAMGTIFVDSQYLQVPYADGFYGLFADTVAPPVPQLNPPPTPTANKIVLMSGSASPNGAVQLILQQAPTTFAMPAFTTDASGLFSGNLYLPSTGQYQIAAVATDEFGNASATSAPVAVSVAIPLPSGISSLSFMDPTFTTLLSPAIVQRNSPAYLQMQASDIDPALADTVYVVVKSTATDPVGIEVPLRQSTVNGSVYDGVVNLGASSNPSMSTLNAQSVGETILAVAEASPTVQASATLGDATLGGAPTIFSPSHPAAFQDTFEDNADQWGNYNSVNGAYVQLDNSAASTGLESIKITQLASDGDFSAVIRQTPFDARQFPIIDFDYKLDPANPAKFNFYFQYQGAYHELTFTNGTISQPPNFIHLGATGSPVADGAWHSMEVDLYPMLNSLYPNATGYVITQLIMGSWQQEQYFGILPTNVPVGTTVNLD